jgi:opacity protein-like surface antigen
MRTAFQSRRRPLRIALRATNRPLHGIEESFQLKSTFLFSILAMVSAALMPLAAVSQVAPIHKIAPAEGTETSYKYEIYAGYGYTSLNQVNGSRYGLQGPELSVTRDFGKHIGIIADGAYYKYPLSRPVVLGLTNSPVVDSVLVGPVFHANIWGNYSGFVQVLLGGIHTGGYNQAPNVSFAGGVGGGMEYKVSQHLAIRAAGDDIASSFTVIGTPAVPDPAASGLSPHRTRSSRATFGVVYKF